MVSTKALFSVAAACGLMYAVASPAIAGLASGRIPVPNDADVAKSRQLVRSAYEEEYQAAGRSGEPASLINALLGAADKGTDPTQQYALLLEAEQLAVQHDDAAAALAIIDRREQIFDIDGLQEKARTLTELAGPKVSGDTDLLTQSMQTAMQAASADRFDIATEAINLAVSIARSIDKVQKAEARKQVRRPADGEKTPALNGPGLIKKAQESQARIAESKKAFTAHEESMKVLEKDLEDVDANTSAATYLCLVKQNWDLGLPYLAGSRHASLAALAKEETSLRRTSTPDVAKRFTLAGKWWAAAEGKEVISGGNDAIRLHAARHYHSMLPQLKDPLELRVAESRIVKAGIGGVPPVLPPPPVRPQPLTVPFDKTQAVSVQNEWARFLGIPVSRVNSAGIRLVLIPPGVFQMKDGDKTIQVTITKPFFVGQTEITRAQWKKVMGDELWDKKVGAAGSDDLAATGMTWDQAVDFCRKLTAAEAGPKKLKLCGPYRLPTEAEWEYAARAGANTPWSFGDNDKEIGEHAWTSEECNEKNEKYVHPVALKKANAWTLHDVHGNVFEWCDDWFSAIADGPLTDPSGPAAGNLKVNRGGSFGHTRGLSGFGFRNRHAPKDAMDFKGFRIAAGISEIP